MLTSGGWLLKHVQWVRKNGTDTNCEHSFMFPFAKCKSTRNEKPETSLNRFFLRRFSGERDVGRSERLSADVRASDVHGVPAVPRDRRPHGVPDHGRDAAPRNAGRHHQRGRPHGQQRTLVR